MEIEMELKMGKMSDWSIVVCDVSVSMARQPTSYNVPRTTKCLGELQHYGISHNNSILLCHFKLV